MLTGMDEDFSRLLARAASGDSAAFESLFRGTQPVLLRYLRTMTGQDSHAAEDVASETWVSVVKCLGTFRGGETDFRAWVLTIARHRMIDTVRARARRPVAIAADIDDAHDPAPDAADAALERLGTADALRLLATLPPDQAEAVLLRVVAGLDTARTAELMERSAGAVRVLTHRGLKALLARLTSDTAVL